jgi:LPS-assembly lipoprotein
MQPVYKDGLQSVTSQNFNSIEIATIKERNGQSLRNVLMDEFYKNGRPSNPQYLLQIQPLEETIRSLGIQKDASSSRAQLLMSTNFALIDQNTRSTLLFRNVEAVTSYNIQDSHFTTTVSEESAREAAIQEIAEQMILQLELFLNKEN